MRSVEFFENTARTIEPIGERAQIGRLLFHSAQLFATGASFYFCLLELNRCATVARARHAQRRPAPIDPVLHPAPADAFNMQASSAPARFIPFYFFFALPTTPDFIRRLHPERRVFIQRPLRKPHL